MRGPPYEGRYEGTSFTIEDDDAGHRSDTILLFEILPSWVSKWQCWPWHFSSLSLETRPIGVLTDVEHLHDMCIINMTRSMHAWHSSGLGLGWGVELAPRI